MFRLIKIALLLLVFVAGLYGDYKNGEKIFKAKCSSCHGGYISANVLKTNFYEKNNEMLHLTSPTVNMLAYSLKDSPLHVGDKNDPEMQKIEIEEFLKDYLYNPNIENSICDSIISKHYVKKLSMKGQVSEEEIADITDYFFEYKERRLKNNPKKVKVLHDIKDTSVLLVQAKKEKKVILIEAMSKNCHFCKTMEKKVFTQKNIQDALEKDFIFVTVDIDKTKLPFGLDKNYKGLTPSFFMIDSSGKLKNQYPGGWTKEDFIEILNENR